MTPTHSRRRTSPMSAVVPAFVLALAALSGCGRSAPVDALDSAEGDPEIAGVSITSPDAVVEADPTAEAVASPSTTTATEEEATTSGDTLYTVESGDTLSKISAQFNVSIDDIAAANAMTDVHTLTPGQQLVIPAPPPEEPPEDQSVEVTVVTSAGDETDTSSTTEP